VDSVHIEERIMVTTTDVFSGLSTDDLGAAEAFYRDVLGFQVEQTQNGLSVHGGDHAVFIYPKPDHRPATYTALYLAVRDVDAAVDELAAAGVVFERYEGMGQDEKGISRGRAAGRGPDIAWFTDPAGNILAVLTE
jgi:predicted enzyme related to lactoylglutathione lyase